LFDKFKAKVALMKDGVADRERAKSPPQSDTELSVASSQNLSQIAKEGRNGRVSTDQPRESVDVARETGTSHQALTAPPIILEEPATVPTVHSPPESGEQLASSAVPLDSTLTSGDAKESAPEVGAGKPTSMTEVHADTITPSGNNILNPMIPQSSDAPTAAAVSTTTKVARPVPKPTENL
jgi:hypothetical protein